MSDNEVFGDDDPALALAEIKALKAGGKAPVPAEPVAKIAPKKKHPVKGVTSGAVGPATKAASLPANAVVTLPGPSPAQLDRIARSKIAWGKALASAKPGRSVEMDPGDLLILGLDVPDDAGDVLTDPDRIVADLDPQWVSVLAGFGWPRGSRSVLVVLRDGAPYIVDGRTLTRHTRKANEERKAKGLPMILAQVQEGEGLEASDLALTASILNAYRMDDTPMGQARRAARLYARHQDYGVVALSMKVTSDQQVKNWVALASAAPSIQKAVEKGDITASAVVPLLRRDLKPEHQVKLLKEALEVGQTGVNEVRARVKNFLQEGDAGDEGAGAGGSLPAGPGFVKGVPPKKRFTSKLIDKIMSEQPAGGPETGSDIDIALRTMRFVALGEAPPKILSGHVQSLLNSEAKRAAGK
jgi:hypothetical protein